MHAKVGKCKALSTYIKRISTSTQRAYREYIKEVAKINTMINSLWILSSKHSYEFYPLTVESQNDFFAQNDDGYEFYSLTKAFPRSVTYKIVTKITF